MLSACLPAQNLQVSMDDALRRTLKHFAHLHALYALEQKRA